MEEAGGRSAHVDGSSYAAAMSRSGLLVVGCASDFERAHVALGLGRIPN